MAVLVAQKGKQHFILVSINLITSKCTANILDINVTLFQSLLLTQFSVTERSHAFFACMFDGQIKWLKSSVLKC